MAGSPFFQERRQQADAQRGDQQHGCDYWRESTSESGNATLVDNVIVEDGLTGIGAGIYVHDVSARILHMAVARNPGLF